VASFAPETIHIIPLGHEIDRAVKYFENSWANRVYLLSLTKSEFHHPEMIERQIGYTKRVKKILEDKKIQVISENIDMFDILEVMKHVTSIIKKEKEKNEKNIIWVNMSACGRLTSVGATLAAMAHNAIVYYVEAEKYSENINQIIEHGLSICEKGVTRQLVNFQLRLPEEESIKIILMMLLKEDKDGKGLKTNFIEQNFIEKQIEGFVNYSKMGKEQSEKKRKTQSSNLMKLKAILAKMEKEGYITREKTGRYNKIKLTTSGKYVAYISGLAE
jgi:hypothetical protein